MKSLRNPKQRPTHPGAVLREDVLPALNMTHTELARLLNVSRLSVSELINEKRAMSPAMAVKIGALFDTSAESWLLMQQALDLWEVRQHQTGPAMVKPLPRARLAALAGQAESDEAA
jgi:addiction module HigA family antidote